MMDAKMLKFIHSTKQYKKRWCSVNNRVSCLGVKTGFSKEASVFASQNWEHMKNTK